MTGRCARDDESAASPCSSVSLAAHITFLFKHIIPHITFRTLQISDALPSQHHFVIS